MNALIEKLNSVERSVLAVAGILTGIIPVVNYRSDAQFLNAPVAFALVVIHQDWEIGRAHV